MNGLSLLVNFYYSVGFSTTVKSVLCAGRTISYCLCCLFLQRSERFAPGFNPQHGCYFPEFMRIFSLLLHIPAAQQELLIIILFINVAIREKLLNLANCLVCTFDSYVLVAFLLTALPGFSLRKPQAPLLASIACKKGQNPLKY